MSCLPSMPKRAWRIWTTPRATSCAEKELPRCSRKSRPQLPQHVQHHCPLALWAKPRTTRWRFGPNSRSSWNTRNSNSATISPKTPCAPLRSVAKTGSTSAANKPDPKSPPSSPSSKPADVGTSPCANTWRRSSPVSPELPSITYPNSPPSPGPHKTADLNPRANHGQPWFAPTRTIQEARSNPELRASANHGRPPVAATSRPGDFHGGAVAAREAGAPYKAPDHAANVNANRPPNARTNNYNHATEI